MKKLLIICLVLMASQAYGQTPGTIKWIFDSGYSSISTWGISIDSHNQIFAVISHLLYSITPMGTESWKVAFVTCGRSPAIGSDDTLYFACGYKLFAVDKTGILKWEYEDDFIFKDPPCIGPDDSIYIGSSSYNLYKFSKNGELVWKSWLCGEASSGPIISSDNNLYIISRELSISYLETFNLNGMKKWGLVINSSLPISGNDGTIYLRGSNYLQAINPDGSSKWIVSLPEIDPLYSGQQPAIAADGTIYVTSGYLNAVSPTGKLKWSLPSTFYGVPSIGADGTIYVGNIDPCLYAITPKGSIKWELPGYSSNSPVLCDDGTLIIRGEPGTVVAIYTDSYGLADSSWPMYQHDAQHTGRVSAPAIPMLNRFFVVVLMLVFGWIMFISPGNLNFFKIAF